MWYWSNQKPRVADEEALNLPPAVVEHLSLPFRVPPLFRVGVLVQTGTVEVGKAVLIVREMRGDPVENDSQSQPDAACQRMP